MTELQPITCATPECDLTPTLHCPACGDNWCEMCADNEGGPQTCPGCEGTA